MKRPGWGGHIEIGGLNIYGLGYIGAQAGNHVERICKAVNTENNLLIFHVGIWKYSPVEIGNMKIEEAHPLAEKFAYVALGHGHKPYVIETPEGKPYAYNPGAPERVNFGEEKYDKGYYLVTVEEGIFSPEFRPTDPRPMIVASINLDGEQDADKALARFREQAQKKLTEQTDERSPLLELRLIGKVGFHPFELGRERLRLALDAFVSPVHLETKNRLSLVARAGGEQVVKKSLAEIERDVLHELIGAHSKYQGREGELARLSLAIRDLVLKGDVEDDELLGLFTGEG